MILAKRLMMCLLKVGWGEWILNPAVTVNTNGISHYTAYKTNQREYYDSYANLDLTTAIVLSLSDTDMQQWQAVRDAANQLTGVTDWVLDAENNQIKYKELKQGEFAATYNDVKYYSPSSVCSAAASSAPAWAKNPSSGRVRAGVKGPNQIWDCGSPDAWIGFWAIPQVEVEEKTLPLDVVASKVISNASSSNQAISLLAEAYLEAVANSIYNADESKQFVKLSDLIDQFEENKVLRIRD